MTKDYSFNRNIVVFVDLLGTSEFISGCEPSKARDFLALLRWIADHSTNFSLDGGIQADGSYKFNISPEISTFSDNVVLSFPIPPTALDGESSSLIAEMYVDMALKHARILVSRFAEEAIKLGILLRGGATVGDFYHANGVALGSALVEAYRLESSVSKYPRIAISSELYSIVHSSDRTKNMRRDKDGIWHLDYLRNLNLKMHTDRDFSSEMLGLIQRNITTYENQKKWNEYSKWFWLHEELAGIRNENSEPIEETNLILLPSRMSND